MLLKDNRLNNQKAPTKGWETSVIDKEKNWVLINKVTEDSVFLYNYFISSRNSSLWNSACGLRTSFKPNIDGVLVKNESQRITGAGFD